MPLMSVVSARGALAFAACCAVGCGRAVSDDVPSADEGGAARRPVVTQGVDWPAFLGPTGDGKSPETGILTRWPPEGPRIVWTAELGEGYGPPAVSGGRLFHFDRVRDQARLTCRDAATGKAQWEFTYPSDYRDYYEYDSGPRAGPVVDGDRVYIHGAEGMLHCVSATDGEPIWKVDTIERFGVVQNFFGVGSAPLVEGDLLLVHIGGSPPETQNLAPLALDRARPNGTAIVAFDKRTGEVVYQAGDELASYASPVTATIDGRRFCFLLARGGLLGLDPATGAIDFHFPWRARALESVNASNPVVVGDLVFISECYGPGSALVRVRPGGYDLVWTDEARGRDKAMQTHWNTPIHVDGYLYGCSGRHTQNAQLRCVELASGNVIWSEPDLKRCSLLYVDGHFVCLTEAGELILLRATPERFDPLARVVLNDPDAPPVPGFGRPPLIRYPAWAAPVLSHGLLYVRGEGRLACLALIEE